MTWTSVAWSSFVPTAFVISALPGANQMLIVRNAVRQGSGDALVGLAGRLGGLAILIVVVAAGVGSALAASSLPFDLVDWLGVAYLTWLGAAALLNARSSAPTLPPARSRGALARQEFQVALTNPKALLLFAVILPRFISDDHQAGAQLLLAGSAYLVVEATVGAGYALLGDRLGRVPTGAITDRRLDRISGVLFIALAALLALGTRG